MNPYVKEEWVKQLKSGNFVQIEGSLRGENNQRCALGVMVDIFIQYHPDAAGWHKKEDGGYELIVSNGLGEWTHHELPGDLPKPVSEWADCQSDPCIDNVDDEWITEPVSILNDEGRDFDEIAALLEDMPAEEL